MLQPEGGCAQTPCCTRERGTTWRLGERGDEGVIPARDHAHVDLGQRIRTQLQAAIRSTCMRSSGSWVIITSAGSCTCRSWPARPHSASGCRLRTLHRRHLPCQLSWQSEQIVAGTLAPAPGCRARRLQAQVPRRREHAEALSRHATGVALPWQSSRQSTQRSHVHRQECMAPLAVRGTHQAATWQPRCRSLQMGIGGWACA